MNTQTLEQRDSHSKGDDANPVKEEKYSYEVTEALNLDEKSAVQPTPASRPMNDLEQHVADTLDDSWETESLLEEMLEGLTDEDDMKGTAIDFPA